MYKEFQKGKILGSSYRVLAAASICDTGRASEAKELVEAAPSEVTQYSSLIEAQKLRDELETLGANVTIK